MLENETTIQELPNTKDVFNCSDVLDLSLDNGDWFIFTKSRVLAFIREKKWCQISAQTIPMIWTLLHCKITLNPEKVRFVK